MIFAGVLDKHPRLRVLFSHAGGSFLPTIGRIKHGHACRPDLVAIDSEDPTLCSLPEAHLLSGLVFAAGDRVVTDLWSAGRHRVREGRHVARAEITAAFRAALAELTARV